MRLSTLILLACASVVYAGLADRFVSGISGISSGIGSIFGANLCNLDVTKPFRRAINEFCTELYQNVAKRYHNHFVLSPYSIWLDLAALAESANGPTQEELLKILRLPKEECLRRKYYSLAISLETPGNDVTLARKRMLIVSQEVPINATWAKDVKEMGLLPEITPMHLSTDFAASINQIRQWIHADISNADALAGKAFIADSLDYSGLWTTAFADADIIPGVPFYNDKGKQIGTVDMMKIRKRVKLAQIPFLNAKALQLPVGEGGRYKLIVVVNMSGFLKRTIELFSSTEIFKLFDSLLESAIPLEVSIPRFLLRTEYNDLRSILEQMGVRGVWGEAGAATANILHRVTVNFTSVGITEPMGRRRWFSKFSSAATGLASTLGREFIANRPFMFRFMDGKTLSPLFTGSFSTPDIVRDSTKSTTSEPTLLVPNNEVSESPVLADDFPYNIKGSSVTPASVAKEQTLSVTHNDAIEILENPVLPGKVPYDIKGSSLLPANNFDGPVKSPVPEDIGSPSLSSSSIPETLPNIPLEAFLPDKYGIKQAEFMPEYEKTSLRPNMANIISGSSEYVLLEEKGKIANEALGTTTEQDIVNRAKGSSMMENNPKELEMSTTTENIHKETVEDPLSDINNNKPKEILKVPLTYNPWESSLVRNSNNVVNDSDGLTQNVVSDYIRTPLVQNILNDNVGPQSSPSTINYDDGPQLTQSVINEDDGPQLTQIVINDDHRPQLTHGDNNDDVRAQFTQSVINEDDAPQFTQSVIFDDDGPQFTQRIISDDVGPPLTQSITNDDEGTQLAQSVTSNDDDGPQMTQSVINEDDGPQFTQSITNDDVRPQLTQSVINNDDDEESKLIQSVTNEDDGPQSVVTIDDDKPQLTQNVTNDDDESQLTQSVTHEDVGSQFPQSVVTLNDDEPQLTQSVTNDGVESQLTQSVTYQ